ncbi:MAG: IS66 family transposase zinc-finger binding domain-containing protein, partial [Clostridium sp.]|nr:IS66 family transposase zinc-finger binding domain-containing protein [Clostridium sp.]
MRNRANATNNADEMITISRAEYDALKEHNAELEQRLNWLTEQYILAKHGKYAFTSEQQEQLVMDGFGRTLNEAELFADADAPEIPSEEELNAASEGGSEHKTRKRTGTVTDIVPKDTPVHVVEHRLEGDGLICPECGETMVEIGKEVRRTLVIKKPEITIREDWYYTYACPKCKQDNTEVPIVEAPKEK